MRRLPVFLILILLTAGFMSCEDPAVADTVYETQACCGDDGHLPPPPPPPPPPDDD